jgi:ArsR family transcriptional regulator
MDKLENLVKILKAISDESRLRILSMLKEKQNLCVCEIREIIGLSQPAISSHLRILENAGLINNSKDGKWINYRLNSDLGIKVREFLNQILLIIKDSNQITSDKIKIEKVDRFKIIKVSK